MMLLVVEKIPFFVLAAASCVVTSFAQQEAVIPLDVVSLSSRIANGLVSYAAYLGQFFYPAGLAILYPHPGASISIWKALGAPVGLGCHLGGGASLLATAPLSAGGLAMVHGNAGACHRLGPGGLPRHGRPIYVFAVDRVVYRGGMAAEESVATPPTSAGHCRGADLGGVGRLHLASNDFLAQQRGPLDPRVGVHFGQCPGP